MDGEPLSVEWVDDPEEWLLPVVAALDDARLCCVPPTEPSGTGGVLAQRHVLRISVETRDPTSSCDRSDVVASRGNSSKWIHDSNLHLIAKESVLRCSSRPLLHTRIGHWLHIKGWTWHVGFALHLLVFAMLSLLPGARVVSVSNLGGPHEDAVTLTGQIPSLVTTCLAASMAMLMVVILFQRTSRDLFIRSACSFECLFMTCSVAISRSAWAYEQLTLVNMAGESTWTDLAPLVIFTIFVSLFATTLCAFDAFFMSPRLRALILTANLWHSMYSYVRFARFTQWSNIEVCQWFYCTTSKAVCVSAYGNYVVFAAKLWLAYVRGDDCAILRTSFRRSWPAAYYHLGGGCSRGRCCRRREAGCSLGCCCWGRRRVCGCSISCCCRRGRVARAEGLDVGAPQPPNAQWPRSPEQTVATSLVRLPSGANLLQL